jgi:hypothetical protein
MERKGVRLSDMSRQHRVPSNLLSVGNQVQAGGRQGWNVQRLANVASRLRPTRVVVKKRAARGQVQHRDATQNRQRPPRTAMAENRFLRVHTPIHFSVPP